MHLVGQHYITVSQPRYKKHKIHFNIIFFIYNYVFPSGFPIKAPQHFQKTEMLQVRGGPNTNCKWEVVPTPNVYHRVIAKRNWNRRGKIQISKCGNETSDGANRKYSFTILHNTVLQIKVTDISPLEKDRCDKTLHLVQKANLNSRGFQPTSLAPVVTMGTITVTFTNPTFRPHSISRVFYGSQNNQPLFPYTALTGRFFNRQGARLLRGTNKIL